MTRFLNPKMLKIGLKKQNIYDIFLRFKVGSDFELIKIFVFEILSFFYYITIFEPQKALEIPFFEHWARYIYIFTAITKILSLPFRAESRQLVTLNGTSKKLRCFFLAVI